MGLKSALSYPFAKYIAAKTKKWSHNPVKTQEKVFQYLIKKAASTQFGKEHHFANIKSYSDFKKQVPIRNYEDFEPYISAIRQAKPNVLWPGLPKYLSKTSGTTSGAKYIPLSKESLAFHIQGARNAILHYIAETRKTSFVEGKMIFLQGSPVLDNSEKIPLGRLSGIVAHYVPAYLQKNRLPSYSVNTINDWEQKVEAICEETREENLSLISGIPPWVQMYFEKLIAITGKKTIQEIFPNFSLFIYGGVNYEPYRSRMERLIGKSVDSIELYPASEGFIAYQDSQREAGMLLLLNAGIFYEFIPANEFYSDNPTRLQIAEVSLGVNYVIILSTNAGLWAYNIGDTVKFVSLKPYRIIVTGRIKHFTSAFGEHIIAEEAEQAIHYAAEKTGLELAEFHLAPKVNPPANELPYHEWFIEFRDSSAYTEEFAQVLDQKMQELNSYYKDLISGKILQRLTVRFVRENGFQAYMKSQGKLGGQNKLPRLSNNRDIADCLENYLV